MGSAEERSPFAGSLRVSLRYRFLSLINNQSPKGAVAMTGHVFQHLVTILEHVASNLNVANQQNSGGHLT